jgi:hypothetical protein
VANHPTRAGSWGKIPRAKKQPDGQYLASGRYKSPDGNLLQRMRRGTTARKAEDSLLSLFQSMAVEDEARSAASRALPNQKLRQGAEQPFEQVVEKWIAYIEAGGQGLRVSTAYEYARIARADLVPSLGPLTLAEIDVSTCADFLHGIVHDGRFHAKAEHDRVILSNILTWCAGLGWIPGNPVRQVASLPRPRKKPVQIVEKEDMASVLAAIRKHGEDKMQLVRPGPRQNMDIAAFWPGVGRKSACSVHLNEVEKDELQGIWDQVVAKFDCPGCSAIAGQECNEDSLVIIDGFYPTSKAFNGRSVHTPRLALLPDR